MTIKEKIEQVKEAYKVLELYVDDKQYFAYLNGLLDAWNIEIDARTRKLESEEE